ncbi:MAG: tRNA dihydrouridine synthase [Phycisphaerales bacterium JB039]
MSCASGNATAPVPAIAPGAEAIDVRAAAARIGERCARVGAPDARLGRLVPGFDAPFFQAGLAGYSDAAMRIIARRHGCPFCVTEALLDRTILAGGRGFAKADLGELCDNVPGGVEDQPLAGQIMGSEPAEMAAAALKMVEQVARPEREYRRMAYGGDLAPHGQMALRLPGGEQVGGRRDEETERRRDGVRHANDDAPPESAHFVSQSLRCSVSPASFSTIDINLACPVKKIKSKARGGHWLAAPAGAIRILEAVREALPAEVPVTVKMRRAFDDTPEMIEGFWRIFDAAYDMGCAWVTVHGRTVQQKYVGPSRWDLLREIAQARPERMVFGSGDVWGAGDIFRMIEYTGVTGVSVARGCIGDPWIFRQARDLMAGREPAEPTLAEQREVLEQHFELALAVNAGAREPEALTARMMRKFGIRFAARHPRAEDVRRRFVAVRSLEEWRGVLEEFYTPCG